MIFVARSPDGTVYSVRTRANVRPTADYEAEWMLDAEGIDGAASEMVFMDDAAGPAVKRLFNKEKP